MSSETGSTSQSKRVFTRSVGDAYVQQINVLRILSEDIVESEVPRQLEINEIAERAGMRDEREVQRYLFILEGQKLVAPHPEGDFTSKTWHITRRGIRAIRTISSAMLS